MKPWNCDFCKRPVKQPFIMVVEVKPEGKLRFFCDHFCLYGWGDDHYIWKETEDGTLYIEVDET